MSPRRAHSHARPRPVAAFLLAMAVVAGAAGCRPDGRPPRKAPYYGATLPLAELIQKINERNVGLPTLWVHHTFDATFFDDKGKDHFVNGDGALMYKAPGKLYMTARKPAAGEVFTMGTDGDTFWVTVPQADTQWWGRMSAIFAARGAGSGGSGGGGEPAGSAELPVWPDQLVQVLGITPVRTALTQEPVPTLRFNHAEDAYMVVWSARGTDPDRWVAQREVWYDRGTLRPAHVILFDPDGRVSLEASLGGYAAVDVPGAAADARPQVATQVRLYFPPSKAKMTLTFDRLQLAQGSGARRVPTDRSFERQQPNVENVIEVR